MKFGAYYYHLWLRPEQPDNARGAFTYTGQFTGNAFADFLLGYPTSAAAGIGRGDENGRTNWLHAYVQDDWRARQNLTLNLGLRYEYNQHMYDADNRLSSIDLSTPGGRFVIASDDTDSAPPERGGSAAADADPVRDIEPGRLGTRPAGSERRAAGAPRRLCADAERFARGGAGRLRRIPESVGVQRADGVRAQPAVLLHQAGGRAAAAAGARADDARHPDQRGHRHDRRQHHGLRLQRRIQPDVERRPAVRAVAGDDARGFLHGHVDPRRRQRHHPQRARARARTDPAAPADSRVEPHQRDPVRRQIDLSRRDDQARAPSPQSLRLQRQLHAVALEGRCLEPGGDRVGGQCAAERPERLRRDRRMGAFELRPPAPAHCQRRRRAAVL